MIALLFLGLAAQEGIAAQYPGDEGIERDPRVLFVEDFETGDVKEIGARWGNLKSPQNMDLPEELHANSPGKRSLHITPGPDGPKGSCQGGHLYTHTRGVDTMHVRFYVKFHEKHGYMHHFVSLIADRSPTPWPKGWAGKRPPGDSHFLSNIEPWSRWGKDAPVGVWNFYSYWQEMKGDARGNYWGNSFMPSESPAVERGRWICVEARVKANTAPDAADGEQAFWIDGKLSGEFKGIRWRSSDKVKLNSLWLIYDVDEGSARFNNDPDPGSRVYEVWFDDVVVATEYIGPVKGTPKGGKKAAAPSRSALLTGEIAPPSPGKVVFAERFDAGTGKFTGGEVMDGALAFPPEGAQVWNAYSVTVGETTSVRFRMKPSADLDQVSVLIWSDKLKDNGRFYITGLKKGEWRTVEFRGVDIRTGWAVDGPSLDGCVMNNIKFLYEGAEDTRLVLDDFEVRE